MEATKKDKPQNECQQEEYETLITTTYVQMNVKYYE